METKLNPTALQKAQSWLNGSFDEETKSKVKSLMDNDVKEFNESFYRDLEFGTGGLRGILGVGTNRMNIYTVGMATQGLANYLRICFPSEEIKVAVSHDCRNFSRIFAEKVADIFASNGFKVYLFDSLRPTPELSFTIRQLGCKSGVMITASHNPKEYNGYKAYWDDGSQVTPPHDTNIIKEVEKITTIEQIVHGKNNENITILDEKFDEIYLDKIHSLSLSQEAIAKHHDIKIVYTPIHGCGHRLVPESLKKFGFTNVSTVKEQMVIDGNFPTVISPNPEEKSAMKLALELGAKEHAAVVMATDPDSDRIGIALPDENGEFVLLNGNQTCVLLVYYLCRRWSELKKLNGNQYVVKTIVTSEMIKDVAADFGVKCFDCLTGFKNIAKIIREQGPLGKQYIGGGEESFGFLAGDFVRDKDGVSACSLVAEATAWALENGTTLYKLLKELYVKYGFFKEALVSVVRKGMEGQQEIKQMMIDYRNNPPKSICGAKITVIKDYLNSVVIDTETGAKSHLDEQKSDVLQFFTADKGVISIRPSGTEPKIKFYFGVCEPLDSVKNFDKVNNLLNDKLERMKKELNLI